MMQLFMLFVLSFCQEDIGTLPVTVRRQIAGPPGVTIVSERNGIVLETTTQGTDSMALSATGQVMVTSWTSGGITREVRTTRLDNETGDTGAVRWVARHAQAERAALQIFPRDPPVTGE